MTDPVTQGSGDPDESGLTRPGELHIDMGVKRPVEIHGSLADDFSAGRQMAMRGATDGAWKALIGTESGEGTKPAPARPKEEEGAGNSSAGQPDQSPEPIPNPSVPLGTRIAHGLWSTAKDIGKGVAVEAIPQVAGGALDFANSLVKFADHIVKPAEEAGLPNIYFELFDKEGKWNPRALSTEEFRKEQAQGNDQIFQVPTTGDAETTTGNIIRTATSFALGRGSGSGALADTVGGGFLGQVARSGVSGTVGQDSSKARLSNVVNEVAPNFVTDFLKADPDQEQGLLDNLKSGLEYAGIDAAFGGVVRAVKALKANWSGQGPDLSKLGQGARAEAKASDGAGPRASTTKNETTPGVSAANDFIPLGDPAQPQITSQIAAQGAHAIEASGEAEMSATNLQKGMGDFIAGMGPNPIKVNLSRVGSSDDIKDIIAQVSTFIPKSATVSHETTRLEAAVSGVTPENVLSGQGGTAGTLAEQMAQIRAKLLATRIVRDSSAQQFGEFAAKAVNPATASPETQAQAIKAFAMHRAIQLESEGAASEAGRILESLKILSSANGSFQKSINDLVTSASVDQQDIGTVLKQAAHLYSTKPEAMSPYMDMLHNMSGRDAIIYGFQNMLLSPRTIGRKVGTDLVMPLWNISTRYLAERFGDNVPQGETAQLAYGYMASLKDGVKLAGKALEAGRSQFLPFASTTGDMDAFTRLYNQVPEKISEATPTKAAAEMIKYAMPTTYIGALDDAAKYVNYRAEVQALAFRDTVKSGMEEGTEAFNERMAGALSTSWQFGIPIATSKAIHEQAVEGSLKSTFQEPLTPTLEKLGDFVNNLNWQIPHTDFEVPFGRIVMPFYKVPVNLTAFAWRNTPLGLTYAQSQLRQQMAAGGATRDIAIAKMTLGSGISMAFMSAAYSGMMTGKGPSEPDLRRAWMAAGNQPYSMRVGDTWYQMTPEPFSQMAATIADTADVLRFAKQADAEQAAFSLAFGMGNALLNRSYMRGVSSLFDTLENPQRQAKNFTENLISSFLVPSTIRGVAEGLDDWQRSHYDIIDKISGDLPFVRNKSLFPQRTLWGDPVPLKDGYLPLLTGPFSLSSVFPDAAPALGAAARVVSPVGFAPADNAEPVDKWIWANRKYFNPDEDNNGRLGLNRIGEHVSYTARELPGMPMGMSSSIQLTPESLDRLQVLAGNEQKNPRDGLGAKDTLNKLVTGTYPGDLQRQWTQASPELQAVMLKKIVGDYRSDAKKRLLIEYPDILDAVKANISDRGQKMSRGAVH